MAAPKRSKIQRERDRLTISELYLKGWSQQQIADYLELDKSGICRELKKIKAEWKAETIEDHNLHVNAELRRLAMLEAEYWTGWERSQEVRESSALGRVKQLTRTEQRTGDVQFLNGILKVVDTRSKLLGLFIEVKPQVEEHSSYVVAMPEESSSIEAWAHKWVNQSA